MLMSSAVLQRGFTEEAFAAFVAERNEPAWLAQLRAKAWRTFQHTPLPDRSQEEWNRTDIRGLRLESFSLPLPTQQRAELPPSLLGEGLEPCGELLAVDSYLARRRLDSQLQQQGVLFGSLDELVCTHEEIFRPYLENPLVDPEVDKFAALAAACWASGWVLYVPRNVKLSRPLHVYSVLSAGNTDIGRALIVLEEGAEATVLAETASVDPSAPGLHCGTVEILVGSRANLRYVSLQDWGKGVWHFGHQRVRVAQDATLRWTVAALGSRLAKVNQHVVLAEPGANAQVDGVMFAEGSQHLSYHTLQHHAAGGCTSDLLYKGALQDRARIVWRGMIRVDPDAQKTDGYQRNDNLMLSDEARVDSIPGLEIMADDVKCSHGATTGRVDDEMIFYAASRGFTRKEATRLIVAGFFQQVFDRITIEQVRTALAQTIARRVQEFRAH
jgi:Fe-S cluster assembly protein SufD